MRFGGVAGRVSGAGDLAVARTAAGLFCGRGVWLVGAGPLAHRGTVALCAAAVILLLNRLCRRGGWGGPGRDAGCGIRRAAGGAAVSTVSLAATTVPETPRRSPSRR